MVWNLTSQTMNSHVWREVVLCFEKWLHIGLGHYISAIDVNPRIWDHLEMVEKMTRLEMGLFGLPLGLFCSSFWRTTYLLEMFTLAKGKDCSQNEHNNWEIRVGSNCEKYFTQFWIWFKFKLLHKFHGSSFISNFTLSIFSSSYHLIVPAHQPKPSCFWFSLRQ